MTPKDRPLNEAEWRNLATNAAAVAAFINSNEGQRVRQLLRDAADIGYPTQGSGTPTTPTNQVDEDGHPIQGSSATERHALNEDPAARFANEHHRALRKLLTELVLAIDTWHSFHAVATSDGTGVRHVPQCGTCGTVYQGRDRTCKCAPQAWACKGCGEQDESKRHGARCMACAKWEQRNGYAKSSMVDYAQRFDNGVFTAEQLDPVAAPTHGDVEQGGH